MRHIDRCSRVASARRLSRVAGGTRVASWGYLEVGPPLNPAGGRPPRPEPPGFTRSFGWTRWGMSTSTQWPAQHRELRGMLYGSVFLAGDSATTLLGTVGFFSDGFSAVIFLTIATGICSK